MVLDPVTILVTHLLIILLVSVSYLVAWTQSRREEPLLWMFGATVSVGIGIAARFVLAEPLSLVLSNGLIESGTVCLWFACRRLRAARVWPAVLPVPLLLWCSLPAVPLLGGLGPRIVIANVVLGGFFLLAAREIWIFARSYTFLRFYMAGLLVAQAGVYGTWAMINLVDPPGPRADLLTLRGLAETDLVSLVTTLLLAIGFIVLVREQTLCRYRQAALLDAVTGIENRRAFDDSLPVLMAEAYRRRRTLAVVMMDVDHFKSYNDLYGHPQGDACLRRIAQALDAAVRAAMTPAGASVYRYGGEEFVALASGLDLTAAQSLAESLRHAVRDLRLPHQAQPDGIVTISMGVAVAEPAPDGAAQPAPAAVLTTADEALYQAKRSGRDRIVIVSTGQSFGALPGASVAPGLS
jgi:diguanylate cyclase (GGDEF)-like protein